MSYITTFVGWLGHQNLEKKIITVEILGDNIFPTSKSHFCVGGEVRSATVCLLEDNTEEAEEAQGMEEFQEAAGDGVQLRQEVVIVNVSQNGDDLVEEVLSNSVVEVVADDSIEVVMETHNPVIDLTEAEDEVVVVDPGIDTRSEKVGKSVEIDLTSSPMPAPGPSPMQCPVCPL